MSGMDPGLEATLEDLGRALRKRPSILFITGAGVSAESGIPTYRGIGGMYDVEATEEGLPIEQVLSGPMLQRRPELTWKYLLQIAAAAEGAEPNTAHRRIADFEQLLPRVWTLTQNIDGLHRAAGSQNLLEIHGDMRTLLCEHCAARRRVERLAGESIPPICHQCGRPMRPNVVLFGEMLPEDQLSTLRQQMEQGFGMVISVGTSSLFPYIIEPVIRARTHWGSPTVEINPSTTTISSEVDYRLPLPAVAGLEALWSEFQKA
jgi:NAD-dependent deacetylase